MRYISLLICYLFFSTVHGAPAEIYDSHKNGLTLGIGAGGTVFETWGFTLRRHFSSRWGISASMGGWFMNNHGHAGLAVGPMFTLAHHAFPKSSLSRSSLRIYLVGYAAGFYFLDTRYDHIERDKTTIRRLEHSAGFGLGAGPGIEYFFTDNFAIHLELPWMTRFRIKPVTGFEFHNSYPNIGGGFTYYF